MSNRNANAIFDCLHQVVCTLTWTKFSHGKTLHFKVESFRLQVTSVAIVAVGTLMQFQEIAARLMCLHSRFSTAHKSLIENHCEHC